MKITIAFMVLLLLCSGCKRFDAEEYYALSEETVSEVIIDYTKINGDYSSIKRVVLNEGKSIGEFLLYFNKTEVNKLTRMVTRSTTSSAEVSVFQGDEKLRFDIGLIEEQKGYIRFLTERGVSSKFHGEKPATKFAKYVFSLLPND
ncbi:hypothetical protein BFP97_19885 [Roseivirga sp. 4D4]|uniref:hypothetical protein n=1 Tax=Roseivirga sp. 4D4 TaxID=1889784 RepID=UPI000853D009|nr:hypothetical protein [Roseivirga sp. 4D4]OEK03639.1 hypothetical protein BFP97_19885 [Roseivirga sp. 4D4]